jgi:hypothetical protein
VTVLFPLGGRLNGPLPFTLNGAASGSTVPVNVPLPWSENFTDSFAVPSSSSCPDHFPLPCNWMTWFLFPALSKMVTAEDF